VFKTNGYNGYNDMSKIVKERLDKWEKTTSREQDKMNVRCFCLWLDKTPEEIVSEFYTIEKAVMVQRWKKDYGDYLYAWYKDLLEGTEVFVKKRKQGEWKITKEKRKYAHNTARTMAYSVAGFIRTTCDRVIFDKTKKIPKAVATTQSEHEFTYEELKRMFTVGDVEERCILQLGVNLGLRVDDFSTLLREPFERAVQRVKSGKAETPYELKLETRKEKIIARSQLTEKTIDVLSTYLQTKETTKYLFSENHRKRHITPRQLNYCLKRLWEKAYTENKSEADNIHWHLLRKYLITTLHNNDIAETSTKMIVGKAIATDYETYLQRVNLSEEFGKAVNQVALGSFIRLKNHEAELREEIGRLEEAILSQEKQIVNLDTRLETVTKGMKQEIEKYFQSFLSDVTIIKNGWEYTLGPVSEKHRVPTIIERKKHEKSSKKTS